MTGNALIEHFARAQSYRALASEVLRGTSQLACLGGLSLQLAHLGSSIANMERGRQNPPRVWRQEATPSRLQHVDDKNLR